MPPISRQCLRILGSLLSALILIFPSVAYSIIVWDGKIVPAWPDQHPAKLSKGTAGSSPASFGFYSNPHGTIYGLTMLVDFSDKPAVFSVAQVKDWLNKVGYSSSTANGSVHDYYSAVSNGKLDLENDVYGYYRATQMRWPPPSGRILAARLRIFSIPQTRRNSLQRQLRPQHGACECITSALSPTRWPFQ